LLGAQRHLESLIVKIHQLAQVCCSAIVGIRRTCGVDFAPMGTNPLAPFITEAEAGAPGAKEKLFSALYAELHRLATRHLQRNPHVSISPTTLLHETYLGVVGGEAVFPDRGRFMGYASRVMRGLIIDFTRQRCAQKRGGDFQITQLDSQIVGQSAELDAENRGLQQLSEALDELATHDARLAEVVDLKYFCGFSLTDIAAMRGVALRTVQRDWEKARLFLFRQLDEAAGS
jgi:RNA polymerase sigma factor (TIGR02999 family)